MWPSRRLTEGQRDWVKIAALLLMTVDHFGAYLPTQWLESTPDVYEWSRGLGRLAMPLFAVLFFESAVTATKESFLRRSQTLLAFAVMTQFAWELSSLAHPNREQIPTILNILFGFSLAYCVLHLFETWDLKGSVTKWPTLALSLFCFAFIDFGIEILAICVAFVLATRHRESDWATSAILTAGALVLYLSAQAIVPFVGLIAFLLVTLLSASKLQPKRVQAFARTKNFSTIFYMVHVPLIVVAVGIASAI